MESVEDGVFEERALEDSGCRVEEGSKGVREEGWNVVVVLGRAVRDVVGPD